MTISVIFRSSALWKGARSTSYVDGMTCNFTPIERIYTRAEAADRLGVTVRTMATWATCKRGPKYSRSGDVRGRVIYRESDLQAWLDERRQESET